MTRKSRSFLLLILLALLLIACRGKEEPIAPTAPAAEAPAESATTTTDSSAPAADPTAEPAAANNQAGNQNEAETISDTTAFLQALSEASSYRYTMVVTFFNSAGAMEISMTMDGVYQAEPPLTGLKMSFAGTTDNEMVGQEVIQVQRDGMQYMVAPGMGCIAMPMEDGIDLEMPDSADMLNELRNLRRVLPNQTINGVAVRHYTFSLDGLEDEPGAQAEGDLYVADRDNYPVRLVMNISNTIGFMGGEEEEEPGSAFVTMNYFDVGKAVSAEIPEECLNVGGGWPMLPDARNNSSFGGMVVYLTTTSIPDAITFYQEQMDQAGYNYSEEESFVADSFASLAFSDDGQTVNVMITEDADSGDTQIMIIAQP
jgi:hypothetical protein